MKALTGFEELDGIAMVLDSVTELIKETTDPLLGNAPIGGDSA
jgi:hypothetical protein